MLPLCCLTKRVSEAFQASLAGEDGQYKDAVDKAGNKTVGEQGRKAWKQADRSEMVIGGVQMLRNERLQKGLYKGAEAMGRDWLMILCCGAKSFQRSYEKPYTYDLHSSGFFVSTQQKQPLSQISKWVNVRRKARSVGANTFVFRFRLL